MQARTRLQIDWRSGEGVIMARLQQTYEKEIVAALTAKFGYKSRMQVPRLTKITLNMGLGEAVADKKIIEVFINSHKFISLTRSKQSSNILCFTSYAEFVVINSKSSCFP